MGYLGLEWQGRYRVPASGTWSHPFLSVGPARRAAARAWGKW
jgi:hypothetical protein